MSPFLWTGTTFVFFHSIENFPLSKQDWKINFRGLQIEVSHILIIADVLFSILLHQMCRAKFWKVNATYSYSFREPPCGRPQSVPKRRPLGNVLGTPSGLQFWTSRRNIFSMHYFWFYFTKYMPETPTSQLIHSYIVCGNIPKTYYKRPKATFGGWCSRDVPWMSILNISTKCIPMVIISVLADQMCVLNTKKLVMAYSFSFGLTP